MQSPKMFERAIANANHKFEAEASNPLGLSDESDEDDESSDDDGDGRPMSVHDMRRQAAENMRPETATSSTTPEPKSKYMSRHTVI